MMTAYSAIREGLRSDRVKPMASTVIYILKSVMANNFVYKSPFLTLLNDNKHLDEEDWIPEEVEHLRKFAAFLLPLYPEDEESSLDYDTVCDIAWCHLVLLDSLLEETDRRRAAEMEAIWMERLVEHLRQKNGPSEQSSDYLLEENRQLKENAEVASAEMEVLKKTCATVQRELDASKKLAKEINSRLDFVQGSLQGYLEQEQDRQSRNEEQILSLKIQNQQLKAGHLKAVQMVNSLSEDLKERSRQLTASQDCISEKVENNRKLNSQIIDLEGKVKDYKSLKSELLKTKMGKYLLEKHMADLFGREKSLHKEKIWALTEGPYHMPEGKKVNFEVLKELIKQSF
ncbi:hypothetical protein QR680_016206 [Steinernema hermaphroditum]|uniref:Uncharacterized protein n=1 Tax=Steinernema hermaphroditum TaxID=289476 RepID=A0AA39HAP1_9BILA|nr:hypothetical protein QR680_016206 [Steinernema hermaphroditum]